MTTDASFRTGEVVTSSPATVAGNQKIGLVPPPPAGPGHLARFLRFRCLGAEHKTCCVGAEQCWGHSFLNEDRAPGSPYRRGPWPHHGRVHDDVANDSESRRRYGTHPNFSL